LTGRFALGVVRKKYMKVTQEYLKRLAMRQEEKRDEPKNKGEEKGQEPRSEV